MSRKSLPVCVFLQGFCGFSGLRFKSLIHFQLIAVLLRACGPVSCFACSSPAFPAPFVHETVFSTLYVLASFSQINQLYKQGFISGLSISVLFVLVPYSFEYCRLVVQFKIREQDTSSFVLLSYDQFRYSRSFVALDILYDYSSSVKYIMGILIGIALNL